MTVQDGNEVFFRIKNTATLKKLMTAYCDRQSQDINAIAFLFDGRRLRPEQTPAEVIIIAIQNSARVPPESPSGFYSKRIMCCCYLDSPGCSGVSLLFPFQNLQVL